MANFRANFRVCRSGLPTPFERDRALSRLVFLWPHELGDTSRSGRQHLLTKLRRALRAERQRGASGHGSYDLGRHTALLEATRAEEAALKTT